MAREVGVLHLWLHNKKRLSKSHKSDFKGYQDALSRKERIFSEKPYLYVSVCPNIPTRDITKNAFLWQGIGNANNPQYAILDWWTELFTNYARTSCAISKDRQDNLRNAANIHWWYWKGKDEVVAQYALTGYAQPIGVSDYQLSKAIPENLKSALPSIEEVEEELSQLLDNKKDEK